MQLRPVAFCPKTFNTTQQNWHVSEQEIYAAIYMVEKWRYLLMHRKFILHTDHKNLAELFNRAKDFRAGKLYRWAVRLQDFHFECRYVKGTDNVMADYLSRDAMTSHRQRDSETVDSAKDGVDGTCILQSYLQCLGAQSIHAPASLMSYTTDPNVLYSYVQDAVRRSKRIASKPGSKIRKLSSKTRLLPTPTISTNPMHETQQQIIDDTIRKVKDMNDKILSHLPSSSNAWNEQILIPDTVPISDYYPSDTITVPLLQSKQIHDPVIFSVSHFLRNRDTALIDTLDPYIVHYIHTGRYRLDHRQILSPMHVDTNSRYQGIYNRSSL